MIYKNFAKVFLLSAVVLTADVSAAAARKSVLNKDVPLAYMRQLCQNMVASSQRQLSDAANKALENLTNRKGALVLSGAGLVGVAVASERYGVSDFVGKLVVRILANGTRLSVSPAKAAKIASLLKVSTTLQFLLGLTKRTAANAPLFSAAQLAELDGRYAPIAHDHGAAYAAAAHAHPEYAAAEHNHDGAYATAGHGHAEYAAAGHNHDAAYAPCAPEGQEYVLRKFKAQQPQQ